MTSSKVLRLSKTLSSKTVLNSASMDVMRAILSKLSSFKSFLKSSVMVKLLKSTFSKCLKMLKILVSIYKVRSLKKSLYFMSFKRGGVVFGAFRWQKFIVASGHITITFCGELATANHIINYDIHFLNTKLFGGLSQS